MPMFHESLNVGITMLDLSRDVQEWSEKTFGSRRDRGPIGPLKHLEKEAREAQDNTLDLTEYADCLIILLDASWRAGFTVQQLVSAAEAKMVKNRQRKWPKATSDGPCEHIKEGDDV